MLAFYLATFLCVALVSGLPTGAPLEACDTMTPMHDIYTPQPTASPFSFTLTSTNVAVGDVIHVSLAAGDNRPFQGFLIKGLAKGQTDGVAGKFSMTMLPNKLGAMPCQYLDCSGVGQSALTHVAADNKTVMEVDWSPTEAGTFNIVGTVVQTFPEFWDKFYSEDITVV
ncbi:hypothetical protein CHUAL_009390 [Chamberlinius hualienensis]